MGCNCRNHYHIGHAVRDSLKKDFVSKGILDERLLACSSCEFLMAKMTCKKCGCFVNVKARFKRAFCPEGLWVTP